jgi:integrase
MVLATKKTSAQGRDIRLYDGRRIVVDLATPFTIKSDTSSYRFDYSWHIGGVVWSESFISILVGLLQTHSIEYSHSCAYYVRRFVKDVLHPRLDPASPLLLKDLGDWINRYGIAAWAFMQAVLSRWADSKLPGLDPDIVSFLRQPTKWETKGKGWYFALVANDPERGAFTEQELQSIHSGINCAYEEGRISTKEWALVWYMIGTGIRPVQIARSKVGDVQIVTGPQGKEAMLMVPLAKKHTSDKSKRWVRKAPTQLAEVLVEYLASASMCTVDSETPLFFDQSYRVNQCLADVFKQVKTYSTRLGGPIPIFPYRFRYTLGTRAIANGASDHVAARLLTHSTTHCIQYYRASMPALQKPLQEAIGKEMSFFAHAFQGRLIDDFNDATRKGDPRALIIDFAHLMGQSLGACGTRAECHLHAPRACLMCAKFEPFRQAPWESLLAILIDDREAEQEDRIKSITQNQINAVHEIIAERDAGMSQ